MTDKKTRDKKQNGRLTLKPLKFEEALGDLLMTDPPPEVKQRKEVRQKKGQKTSKPAE